jgi:hypothetical protein
MSKKRVEVIPLKPLQDLQYLQNALHQGALIVIF